MSKVVKFEKKTKSEVLARLATLVEDADHFLLLFEREGIMEVACSPMEIGDLLIYEKILQEVVNSTFADQIRES